MSDTVVSVLTPPGSGAIATVEVIGPRAWEVARQHFRPTGGKTLPASPPVGRFWFGNFGGDEVVLAAKAADRVEVHCHGGRRVVAMIVGLIEPLAALRGARKAASGSALDLLPFAPTLRTASILLDQLHGAFDREVRRILSLLESNPAQAVEPLRKLASFAPVGRHLIEPWKVVVAGPPNVGKSSLVNALAGYQRSVVSEVAGTTRDAVGVRLAFDGWPVELIDTAGLRESEGLEAEGVALAERVAATAHVIVWVLDSTAPVPSWPDPATSWGRRSMVFVLNKVDCPPAGWVETDADDVWGVSANSGHGVGGVIDLVLTELGLSLWDCEPPGRPVPFTPHLAGAIETAHAVFAGGESDEAKRLLRACLGPR